ncbi:Signal peptidase complex subunit 1 [Chytriomyces hyalinus]|nr:Signal peptidase complex subunit 1 [Chytriomyces hyalinus]KAJ3249342.1 Signal peptidase complex subunit 1 [Chytriomyces hyalinus]
MGKKESLVDYSGQILVERIFQGLMIVFGIISFFAGYAYESLLLLVAINVAGFLLAMIICVPPWPMFRSNSVKWLPKREKPVNLTAQKQKPWWMKLLF